MKYLTILVTLVLIGSARVSPADAQAGAQTHCWRCECTNPPECTQKDCRQVSDLVIPAIRVAG
jgi:hypothetical protein